ncbi:Uncharacterised protein [Escherichia coli]|uniref:Uncharacterized protein n=1 Tax=Escherichia coli TaxID=562 RepID=A0A484Z1W1_ECOLX|nr:Uncharacterised protein [Escherichia coli]
MKLQKQLLEAVEHKQLRPAGRAVCPDRGGR